LRHAPTDNPEHSARNIFFFFIAKSMLLMASKRKNIAAVWFISEPEVKIILGERINSTVASTDVSFPNISRHRRYTRITDTAAKRGFTIQGLASHKPAVSKNGNPGGY